jgi:hypothetical protein
MAEFDEPPVELVDMLRFGALRVLRGVVLGGIAACLSYWQRHVDYPEWQIAAVVFVLSLLNRRAGLASLPIALLLMLYLVPPEMTAQISAWIRGLRAG